MASNNNDGSANSFGTNADQTSGFELNTVAVKLPQFWTKMPEMWFARAEAQFRNARITQQSTMFDHVVATLTEDVMQTVFDIISEPGDSPYDTLKRELISRHSKSETRRIEDLLSSTEMGDRRPSEFYRQMLSLAGQSVSEDLVRTLWIRRLPPLVQAVLKGNCKLETSVLLQMADNVFDVSPQQSSIFATNTRPMTSPGADDRIQKLEDEINELKGMISKLSFNDRSHRSSRSRSRNGERRSSSDRPANNMCWYHRVHGANARKCIKPCSYSSQNSSN